MPTEHWPGEAPLTSRGTFSLPSYLCLVLAGHLSALVPLFLLLSSHAPFNPPLLTPLGSPVWLSPSPLPTQFFARQPYSSVLWAHPSPAWEPLGQALTPF